MLENRLKEWCLTRQKKLGLFVAEFATPGIGHIIKAAGGDFVFLDMEHSGFGMETIKSAIRYFEAAHVPCIVRVPSQDYHFLARVCDIGAEGIVAPMISTPEQARAVLNSIKYQPLGNRGVGLGFAHDNYRAQPVSDALAHANDRTTFFCLIETAEGAENADAIAAIDGVDCLWIGHFDLSVSLGVSGQFEHPKFVQAYDKIVSAAKKHNKSLARMVANPQQAIHWMDQSFNFICNSGDIWILRDALSDAFSTIRAGVR